MKRYTRSLRSISTLFSLATIVLSFATSPSLALEHPPTGSLTIWLVDMAGAPVGSGTFELATSDGTWFVSDESGTGELVLTDVPAGSITVSQVAGPNGYTVATPVTVDVIPGEITTATLVAPMILSPPVDGDVTPLPGEPKPALGETLPHMLALQALPLNIVVGCPAGLDSAQPGQDISYTVTITNDAQPVIFGVTLDSARLGAFRQYPFEIETFGSITATLVSTFTAADLANGHASIPDPGVTVTDGNGNSASSGRIDCIFAPPAPGTVQLGEIEITQASCVDGYRAPQLILPESGGDLTYWAEPSSDIYAPGDQVTVYARWSSAVTVPDPGSWTPDPGAANTAFRVITFDDVPCWAEIEVTKTADIATFDAPGDVITYTLTVTNSGERVLTGVTLIDDLTGLSALDCDASIPGAQPALETILAGETITCTATYTIGSDDVATGSVTNIAAASAIGVTPRTASATVHLRGQAGLFLTTSVIDQNAAGYAAGETIRYALVVTNTGNVPLSNVTITDALVSDLSCGDGTAVILSLAPGTDNAVTCTASYTVTQADIDRANPIVNHASVAGIAPDDAILTDAASVTANVVPANPAISLAASASRATIDAAGQNVSYTFTVTNDGNVTMTTISITGDMLETLGIDVTCPELTLAPGASLDCSATYAITQNDLDRGELTTTASAGALSQNGLNATADASVTITAAQSPRWTFGTVVTAVNGTPVSNPVTGLVPGDVVSYALTATNTGNVTLTDVEITSTLLDIGSLDCPQATSLAPAKELECTVEYTITQADLDRGSIVNEANVSGKAPDGQIMSASDAVTIRTADAAPSMILEISASPDVATKAGDQITYTFTVTNTGNVTISDVAIDDPMLAGLGIAVACPETRVAPAANLTCTAVSTITQTDMNSGLDIENTASASGLGPERDELLPRVVAANPRLVTSAPSSVTVRIAQAPALSIAIVAVPLDDTDLVAGARIIFTFNVANTGNISLADIVVDDPMLDAAGITVPPVGDLDPGESRTVSATYIITDADIAAGSIHNEAAATNGAITSDIGSVTVSLAAPAPTPSPTPTDPTPTPSPAPSEPVPTPSPTVPTEPDPTPSPTPGQPSTPDPAASPTIPVDPSTPIPDPAATPGSTANAGAIVVTGLPSTGTPGESAIAGPVWIVALVAAMLLSASAIGLRHRPEA